MPFMLPRDLDVDAHNAKVRAWREEEAKRAAKLRESKTTSGEQKPIPGSVRAIEATPAEGETERHASASSAPLTHQCKTTSGSTESRRARTGTAPDTEALRPAPSRERGACVGATAGVAPGPLTHSKSVMKRLTALGLQDNPAALAANALTHQRPDAAPSGRARADVGQIYPLVGLCRAAGLPEPIPEYRFHYQRKWRADFAWPIHRIIVEIDGGVWTQGRHTRGAGFIEDQRKHNAAQLLGYHVLRYTPDRLGECIADLRIMFAREAA